LGALERDKFDHRRVQLVLVTHRRRAALEVAHIGALLGDDEGPFELAGIGGVDAEVGGELHRATHALGDVAERSVGERRRVERREEVVPVGDDRAEVLAHEIWMVLDGFGEGAEDDAGLGKLLLEGRGDRHRVDDRVHRHAAEALLLREGDPELVEHRPQLGVDLVEARQCGLGLGRCVVADVLIIDGRIADVSARSAR